MCAKQVEGGAKAEKKAKVPMRSAVANRLVGELRGKTTLSELAAKVDAAIVAAAGGSRRRLHGGRDRASGGLGHVRRVCRESRVRHRAYPVGHAGHAALVGRHAGARRTPAGLGRKPLRNGRLTLAAVVVGVNAGRS